MAEESPPAMPEPPDHHVYRGVMFDGKTLTYLLKAVQFYESRLEENVKSVRDDPELNGVLDQDDLDSYPVGKQLDRMKRIRSSLEHNIEQLRNNKTAWIDITLPHGTVRLLKSVEILYLGHLRRKRDAIAARPTTSRMLLEAIDQQLAKIEERIGAGVFRAATPHAIIVEQSPPLTINVADCTPASDSVVVRSSPPRVLESIQIRDPELRRRCLDLFDQFRQDGEHDRLDTVISEATRILEDRLRSLSGAPPTCIGGELAAFAFAARPAARLVVSEIPTEQEGAHLLYRGVFGFVRNSAHHRLLGDLQPERVLQVVGTADYLISVAEAARRELPPADTVPTASKEIP
jgi:Protein of unknown function (Hypoth_ymh)